MIKYKLRLHISAVFLGAIIYSQGASALPEPQHSPSVGGQWAAYTNDDSSLQHEPIKKYDVCFSYDGQSGTHDVYKTTISDNAGFQATGIAHQEGDQVFLFADEGTPSNSHITSQWDIVEGETKSTKPMGTGHWTQWEKVDYSNKSFRNVFYKKEKNICSDGGGNGGLNCEYLGESYPDGFSSTFGGICSGHIGEKYDSCDGGMWSGQLCESSGDCYATCTGGVWERG